MREAMVDGPFPLEQAGSRVGEAVNDQDIDLNI